MKYKNHILPSLRGRGWGRGFLFSLLLLTTLPTFAQQTGGEVITMDKAMFIRDICDYEHAEQWTYKGTRPCIIDLYADWCGPCRMMSPVMQELANEYADSIFIYKVNVDKEKEIAALFRVSSIPLFVFIPMQGEPKFYLGAATKQTFKETIDDFLLKQE